MATAPDSGRLRLRLAVRTPAGPSRDVEIEAAPEAPAEEVADALARELGLDGVRLVSPRTGRALGGTAPLARLGLCQGDEVVAVADGDGIAVAEAEEALPCVEAPARRANRVRVAPPGARLASTFH